MGMSCAGVCQGWIKHATLINNCYPTGPGETLPKSSELSYLVFYANSKPAKLTKCGIYLEKRVATDVRKRRKQDTEVSLQIIKALIDECKKDLNLFSKNVVKIISASLSTNDIDLVSRATSVFITFCAYHNGSTLGVDTEFTSIYESLIDQFAKYATWKYDDQNLDNLERRLGLYALQGAATSSALNAPDAKTQLQYIIPAILHNLTDDKMGLEALQKNDNNPADPSASQSRRFSASSAMISIEDNTLLAYHCLEQLFNMSNASNLRYYLEPTFTILDENKFWWPNSFGISLILVILSSIQQQYRHILVGDIIQRLESSGNSDVSKKITFIEMLTSILTSDLTLFGLSVLEVLDYLLSHLINSLKNDDIKFEKIDVDLNFKTDNTLTEKVKDLETIFIRRLIICIGSLATHVYYANQIGDIVERIVQHLKLQSSTESQQGSNSNSSYMTDGIPLSLLRKTLLKCLSMVVRTNKEAESKSSGKARGEVPVEIFHNSIDLCADEDLSVRIAYAQVLSTFLNNVNTSEESKEIEPLQITYFNQPAIHFLNTLHLTLYKYTLLNDSNPADNIALLVILRSLLIRFRADQIVRGIPVVFKLQSEAKDEKLDGFARQRALASTIALYFSDIAQVLDIPELQQYIENIQKERIEKYQWSTYIKATSSENNFDNVDLSLSFEDEITNENNQPLQPVDIWLDRQIIVPMLCKHKEIENIGGTKLEEKLMAEWKQEEGFEKVKKEAYRIRSSRILEAEKPRLVITPYIMNLENNSDDLTPKVKADNFKETLAVQLMNDSSEHETSVASDRESSNMVPIHVGRKKRKNSPKHEASAFLSTIDTRAASTTSLVNPPYQF
ncbi:14376_t:CDS:10 [Funneliformis geosporum]|uniref:17313_t:CDS:1 n=1 Tax=Funneliformis geosporum TaxID=1117311 RepID=A0A9W4SX67_9GLOM|nr:14376_t:CDS:10 [Funneliformis geosporum]CAI2182330.1 17313_t:CDS:10 [Funneliformis geosporum]